MSHEVRVHPAAAAEAAEAEAWYAAIDPPLADAFVAALLAVLQRIRSLPLASAPHLDGTRRVDLRGFPYAIVFRVTAGSARVLAVMHEKRRPGYWRSRG